MNNKERLLTKIEIESIASRISLKMFHGKRILITGGTGMVGSYLVEALCSACEIQGVVPKEVHLITRQGNYSKFSSQKGYKYVTVSDPAITEGKGLRGFEYFIHAASPASPINYPRLSELIEVNVGMLEMMITEETERVLYISSGEIYGADAPAPVSEDYVGKIDPLVARSAYPLAKIEAERVGAEICRELKIDFRIARLFHTFGPGVREDDGRSFADFLWQCARGNEPTLFSMGQDVRTFLYSEDAIVAMLNIVSNDKDIGPINVGSEEPVTILEFANRVSEISGHKGRVRYGTENVDYVASPNHVIIPDTLKLRDLGWKQKITLDETIARTLSWIMKQID